MTATAVAVTAGLVVGSGAVTSGGAAESVSAPTPPTPSRLLAAVNNPIVLPDVVSDAGGTGTVTADEHPAIFASQASPKVFSANVFSTKVFSPKVFSPDVLTDLFEGGPTLGLFGSSSLVDLTGGIASDASALPGADAVLSVGTGQLVGRLLATVTRPRARLTREVPYRSA